MSPNTREHSPNNHDKYYHQPDSGAHLPTVTPESMTSLKSPFECYAHASFSSKDSHSRMATLFLGVGLLRITSDTDTSTTLRESRFYEGRNIPTVVAAELATEETACDVILAGEIYLLAHHFVHYLEELSIHKEYYRGTSCCYSATMVKEPK